MQQMDHYLTEETADSTQAVLKLAHDTTCSPPQGAPIAAPALVPHRSAAPMQPMDHCLNEETADSNQAGPRLAHGTACSPPEQASTAAPTLVPHRSAAPMLPMYHRLAIDKEIFHSAQVASKLTHGTACSLGQQAPTAALALAPHRSATVSQPMDHCLDEETADSTQAAPKLAHGAHCMRSTTPSANCCPSSRSASLCSTSAANGSLSPRGDR